MRLLVADDSETIQKAIRFGLAPYEVSFIATTSLQETIQAISQQRPNLMILDAALTGTDGPEDFAKLARLAPRVPIILLEGSFEPINLAAFQSLGLQHVLRKPFSSEALLQRIMRDCQISLTPVAGPESAPSFPDNDEKSFSSVLRAAAPVDFDLASLPPEPPLDAAEAPLPQSMLPEALQPPSPAHDIAALEARLMEQMQELSEALQEQRLHLARTSKEVQNLAMQTLAPTNGDQAALNLPESVLARLIPEMVRTIQDYCHNHFATIASEVLTAEIRRLAQERDRQLVDN